MSKLVEKVARAMAPKVFEPFAPELHGSPVNQAFAQNCHRANATAAIAVVLESLQEPSEGMVEAYNQHDLAFVESGYRAMLAKFREEQGL